MGSISVVVVFSSRLNFSGGPEPPSPAARLLPGPDMAAAAGAVQGLPRNVRREAAAPPSPAEDGEHRYGRSPNPAPHIPAASRPTAPGPSPAAGSAERRHLGFTRRHPASQHRAQAPQAMPDMVELHFLFLLVALCPSSRVSSRTSPLSLSDWPVGGSYGN